MNSPVTRRTSLLAVLLLLAATGRAATVAYDGFAGYTDGTLSGQGLGYGWAGNWSASGDSPGSFLVNAGLGLSYAGLPTAPGGVTIAPVNGTGLSRSLASPVGSGSLFFGVLLNIDNPYGIQIASLGGSTGAGVVFGQYNGVPGGMNAFSDKWQLTVSPTGNINDQFTINTNIAVASGTTYLVGKIDFDTSGSLDTVRMFVNPTDAAFLDNNANAQAVSVNSANYGSIGSVGAWTDEWSQWNTTMRLDEIRLATTSSGMFAAIPEFNHSAIVTGIGMLLFGFLRRKRSRS